ncbi:MAG: PD-(D/E)XK nuclease-like domain-containing protein [Proteobacteria bacterium]|nr:PD-(D/E)XK nuclease-like domain-containing protein [Pseudomonadota bacterium]MDA1331298.1 PD-(D/E)XK nuclease-like domain-containing protein [Pseudomonadota bacterium]
MSVRVNISPLILKPGECLAIQDSLNDYLARTDFVSSSDLRSQYHEAKGVRSSPSRGVGAGSVFHRLMLEESEDFELDLLTLTDDWLAGANRSSGCRLDQSDLHRINEAREKLNHWSGHLFSHWINLGQVETSIYWKDEACSQWRARPDLVIQDLVVDLKTFSGKNQRRFLKSRDRHGYLIQAGLYLEALRRLNDRPLGFAFLCIDLTPPFDIRLDVLDKAQIILAQDLIYQVINQ